MRTVTALVGVGIIALGGAACGGKKERKPSDFPGLGKAPYVNVIDAGGEPRAALTWTAPAAGYAEPLRMLVDVDVTGEGHAINASLSVTGTASVARTLPSGDHELVFAVDDVGLDESGGLPFMMLGGAPDALEGRRLARRIDKTGKANARDERLDDGRYTAILDTRLDQLIQLMTVPFPDAPIGVGARWEVLTYRMFDGMKVRNEWTFELTALNGTSGEATFTVTQSANDQKFTWSSFAGDPFLNELESSGAGTIRFDLARPGASVVTLKTAVIQRLMLPNKGDLLAVEIKANTKARVDPGPKP